MPNARIHYYDSIRGLASLLGIYLHAALLLTSPTLGYGIAVTDGSALLENFAWLVHLFRMPVFMIAAGYFSHMSLQKRPMGVFLRQRLLRIGLPLFSSVLILLPLQRMLIWAGQGEPLSWPNAFRAANPLGAGFSWSHLWFLYHLLMYTAAVLVLRALIPSWARPSCRWLARWATSRRYLIHLAFWCGSSLFAYLAAYAFMHVAGSSGTHPLFPVLFIAWVSPFFAYGWLMFGASGRDVCGEIQAATPRLVRLAAIAALFAGSQYAESIQTFVVQLTGMDLLAVALRQAISSGLGIAVTIECMLLAVEFGNRRIRLMSYLSSMSYPVYLFHMPVVLAIGLLFVASGRPVNAGLAFLVITTIGVVATYAVSELLVNRIPLTRLLFSGMLPRRRSPLSSRARGRGTQPARESEAESSLPRHSEPVGAYADRS